MSVSNREKGNVIVSPCRENLNANYFAMVSDYPLHVANSLIVKCENFYTASEIFFRGQYGGKRVLMGKKIKQKKAKENSECRMEKR